jgi:Na+/proline symporter
MYEMVQNAYNVTLTGAFVPLMAGAFWRRANTQGALFSVVCGVGTWLALTLLAVETLVPANLWGLFASFAGMLIGSLLPAVIRNQGQSVASALHHASHVHPAASDAKEH